jgi:Uri superfamily endonuclease
MHALNSIPSTPGTYVIIFDLQEGQQLTVGKLGKYEFPMGSYAYVGSAQGSGGLAGRLRRHLLLSYNKPPHWHIDHLNRVAEITQIWWQADSVDRECTWAETLSTVGTRLIGGFGSSDCGCPGHLIWFPPDRRLNLSDCMKTLGDNLRNIGIQSISKDIE